MARSVSQTKNRKTGGDTEDSPLLPKENGHQQLHYHTKGPNPDHPDLLSQDSNRSKNDDGKSTQADSEQSSVICAPRSSEDPPEHSQSFESGGAIDQRPLFMVTVLVVLSVCATNLHSIFMSEFLYQYFAKEIFGNVSVDTSSHPCASNDNTTNGTSQKAMVQRIQDITSSTTLHLDLTSYGIGMLSNLILGTYSSIMSRKLLLFIPTTGYLIRLVTLPVAVHWELNVNWLFLAYAVDGLCGGTPGILLGTYLYTSDVTPRDPKRTLGVAIIESAKGGMGGVFLSAGGQLIQHTGYIIPAVTSAVLQLLCLCIVMALPDRKPEILNKSNRILSPKEAFLHMISPFQVPKSRRVRIMIGLASFAFFGTLVARLGIEKVQYLYLMNFPFCFNAVSIGWLLFARELLQHTFNVVAVILCYRFFPGMRLGIFGAVCSFAGFILFALAQNKWEVYLVPVVSIGQNLIYTLTRGEGSRLLPPDCQGPFFASLAVLESISFALGSVYLSIYRASLSFLTSFSFYVSAFVIAIVFVLLWLFHVLWVRHLREKQCQILEVSTTEKGLVQH